MKQLPLGTARFEKTRRAMLRFAHWLKKHKTLFEAVGLHLQFQGMKVSGGTPADATIINAPSSTMNNEG